ncbi:chaperonin family protein RbcX [Calothrix parasitica NIES-267]|uniref:RuBisCO chaperone RbcX n=1 Tax=Calothrix parasitica NIES-267 TaxID=1973488 RepID=A0A1Z4LP43_9CYAN|nr:chaperonin family protein RbcX [Calothrix parasitica NIES-267]
MDIKRIAKDTAKMLQSYLTYQAVRTVSAQINETNPYVAAWLHRFSTKERIQDGELYIQQLFLEKPELALRIMTVRQHLAEEMTEFLPEMVSTGIVQANMEHRRQHLERITQLDLSNPSTEQQSATDDSSEDSSENS